MLFRPFFLLIFIIVSCSSPERHDVVFDNFESGTFNKWTKQGVAFEKPIRKDSVTDSVQNIRGMFFAYSVFEGSGMSYGQGKLVSRPFKINRKYIHFLMAGGNHTTRLCVNLVINNKVVRVATGANDMILRNHIWNVDELQGQEAVIEVVDAIAVEYDGALIPYVLVDNFTFSDNRYPTIEIFEDFENGTYYNWDVEGEAFEIPRNRTNVYYPITPIGFNGKFFAFSFGETHDVKVGKLTSKPFTIDYDGIRFLIGGGAHKGLTCINLLINDSIVFSQTGENDGQMRLHEWDVTSFKGEEAILEIVDNYAGGWGHIMVDDIIFYNRPIDFSILYYIGIGVIVIVLGYAIRIRLRPSARKPTIDLSEEEMEKFERLKESIEDSKIYKEHTPSIKQIVQDSGVAEEDINFLFENIENSSLTNFINYLRVEEFKRQLKDPSNAAYTMMYLAEKSGFSSKTSFYRVFKSITKITPSEYKKSLDHKQ